MRVELIELGQDPYLLVSNVTVKPISVKLDDKTQIAKTIKESYDDYGGLPLGCVTDTKGVP